MKNVKKFYDDGGNKLEIETRGIRKCDSVYFKMKDISEGFGLDKLRKSLVNTKYKENKDYIYFTCEYGNTIASKTSKKKNIKR